MRENIFLSKGNTVIRISFQRITTTFNEYRNLIISNEKLDFEEFFSFPDIKEINDTWNIGVVVTKVYLKMRLNGFFSRLKGEI